MKPEHVSVGYWIAVFVTVITNAFLLRKFAPTENNQLKIYYYVVCGFVFLLSIVPAILASSYMMGTIFAILALNMPQLGLGTVGTLLVGSPFGILTAFLVMYFAIRVANMAFQKVTFLRKLN